MSPLFQRLPQEALWHNKINMELVTRDLRWYLKCFQVFFIVHTIVCLDLQVSMPLKGTVQLLWHWMWKYLTVRGLICDTKPLLWHLTDKDLLIAWTIRSSDFFYLKTPIRWLSESVNKKSWLQAVLKHCINFSDHEHIPLCDIYSLKFSLGVWSWELFLYKKQNMIFFSWKEFLSIGVRCSAEEASLCQRLESILGPRSPFSVRGLTVTLYVPCCSLPSLEEKSVSLKGISRIPDGVFC